MTVTELGERIVGGLTPQYLGLVVLNVAFLGCIFYLLVQQSDSRERALAPLLLTCSKSVPAESFDRLLEYAMRLPRQTAP